MTKVRTFSRLTSVVVVLALVAVTTLMVCGAAFGAPMTGDTMPGSSACPVGSHDSLGSAAVSAESPRVTVTLSAVLSTGVGVGIPQGFGSRNAAISAELPPPSDPRHGRIRV
ncbi:MAG: hypothetical protein Q8K89_06125 [Actinomycetota bacterium]|nr:hypothetical protein [Actinomycetota bacterium]